MPEICALQHRYSIKDLRRVRAKCVGDIGVGGAINDKSAGGKNVV